MHAELQTDIKKLATALVYANFFEIFRAENNTSRSIMKSFFRCYI
jgi:hypothetical protein